LREVKYICGTVTITRTDEKLHRAKGDTTHGV